MHENEIATKVIGIAIDVHRKPGPGLLESAYKECMYFKLLQACLMLKKKNQCR